MSYLIRKIQRSKWDQVDLSQTDDVSADAITLCLKTTSNSLSVWRIDNEDDLDQAVLAIVANQDHIDTIDVIWMDEHKLREIGIELLCSPGITPVPHLVDTHVDIAKLTYSKIGLLKDEVVQCINSARVKRYTVAAIKKILLDSIEKKLIAIEDLKESVRNKISVK